MWYNTVQQDRPQMTIWRMRIAFWIPKATDTYSEYVIIIGFPRRNWLRERVLLLRLTYTAATDDNTAHVHCMLDN
jgi:hypothetical protein